MHASKSALDGVAAEAALVEAAAAVSWHPVNQAQARLRIDGCCKQQPGGIAATCRRQRGAGLVQLVAQQAAHHQGLVVEVQAALRAGRACSRVVESMCITL